MVQLQSLYLIKNSILDTVSWLFRENTFRWWTMSLIQRSITIYLTLPTILCTAISMRSINTVVIHTINSKIGHVLFVDSISWLLFLLSYSKSELSQFYYYVLIPHSHSKIISAWKTIQLETSLWQEMWCTCIYSTNILLIPRNINFTFFY